MTDGGRAGRWSGIANLLTLAAGRHPDTRAVAQFYLATMARVERHRFVLAIALGIASAWGLPAWFSVYPEAPRAPRADLLGLSLAMMLFALAGLRIAASLPGDLRASWLFEVSPPPRLRARAALERLLLMLAVLPVVLAFAPVYWWLWGPVVTIVHSVVVLSMGVLVIQVLLWRFGGQVCVQPWDPQSMNLGRSWPAYAGGFALVTAGVPPLEVLVFDHPLAAAFLAADAAIVAVLIRHVAIRQKMETPILWDAAPGEVLGLN